VEAYENACGLHLYRICITGMTAQSPLPLIINQPFLETDNPVLLREYYPP
jgi:hypothetical protein